MNNELKETTKKKVVKKTPVKKTTAKKVTPKKKTVKKDKLTEEKIELVQISPILKEEIPEEIKIESTLKAPFIKTSHEFKLTEVVFIMLLTTLIGFFAGGFILGINQKEVKQIVTIKATEDKEFNKIIKAYNNILEKYINEVDKEDLITGAIDGMLSATGDPYTSYFDEKETTTFYKRIKGSFIGIGAEITSNGKDIYIGKVLKDSPAEKAGVLKLDMIKSVNDVLVSGKTPTEVVTMIETSKTSAIKLVIVRNNEEKTIEMKKGLVTIESVESTIYKENNKNVGYLKIDIFAENTYSQFKKKLEALEKTGIDSLIIDVRDNTGGYLTTVSDIASLFLSKDKVIYQLQTKDTTVKKYSSTDEKRTYKVTVLVNQGSASASEVLAGALKDEYKGEIVGVNTYGKSSVQHALDLGDGTMMKYTVQKWLTSNGTDVGEKGLTPTVYIEQNENYYTNPIKENDAQLNKALSNIAQ